MAAKSTPAHIINAIVADWRTGEYTQRELALKHKVSAGLVAKHTKGVDQDVSAIVSAGVQYKQGLATHGEQSAHVAQAIENAVDQRTRHLNFFNDASLTIARKAVDRVQTSDEMTMADMRHASEIVAKQREGVLGKAPDVAVQINNNMQQSKAVDLTDDELASIATGRGQGAIDSPQRP